MKSRQLIGVIRKENVGTSVFTPLLPQFARYKHFSDVIGRVQACDVGKYVYLVGAIVQVENNEQMQERIKQYGDRDTLLELELSKAAVDVIMQDFEKHLKSLGAIDTLEFQQDLRDIRAKVYKALISSAVLKKGS